MTKRTTNDNLRLFTLAAGLVLAAACKKSTPPAPVPAPAAADQLSMPPSRPPDSRPAPEGTALEGMKRLDALGDAQAKLAEIDQRTMVIPAPPDFKPEPIARKIRLNLILEKSKIRAGEEPRFRLELTNVGREPIDYQEYESSIFKGGSILHSMRTISFYLTDKTGKRLDLLPALGKGRPAPVEYHAAKPDSEKEMLASNAMSQASTTFKVKLLPGETLRSLGDGDSAQEPFRTLRVEEGFSKPGTYQLQVKLDDRPSPLTKSYLKFALRRRSLDEIKKSHAEEMKEAVGPASSNAVTLTVTR